MEQVKRYSQTEKNWKDMEERALNMRQLAQGFQVADIYLNRSYLDNFVAAPIIPAGREILNISDMRIIEISKLVFDEKEKFIDKLMSVYSALYSLDSAVALIIDSDGTRIHFYMHILKENI